MPTRDPQISLRARAIRRSRGGLLRHPSAMLMVVALAIATSMPHAVLADDPGDPGPTPTPTETPTPGPTDDPRPTPSEVPTPDPTPTPALAPARAPDRPEVRLDGVIADPSGRAWARTNTVGNAQIQVMSGSGSSAVAHQAWVMNGSGWTVGDATSRAGSIPIAWSVGATSATFAVAAVGADGGRSEPALVVISADLEAPVATIDSLAVEQGDLTLRWSDSDGQGAGTVERTIRLQSAPATSDGCGTFVTIEGWSLGEGDYDDGTITLGPPPTTGCMRATIELVDRVGLRSNTAGAPLRIKPVAGRSGQISGPAWSGGLNTFRTNAFVTQKDFKWCVAASVQMMVNIARHRSDRTAATQKRMIAYAQLNDNGPYGPEGGTDVTGWIKALKHFGAGNYRAVGANSPGAALRIAAIAMRQTGRPAGMLVMDGRHAWVLHGFESKTDPRRDRYARISSVRVSGPLYPIQQKGGYDLRPNTELSVRALTRYFKPTSIGALVGKYVVIVPVH